MTRAGWSCGRIGIFQEKHFSKQVFGSPDGFHDEFSLRFFIHSAAFLRIDRRQRMRREGREVERRDSREPASEEFFCAAHVIVRVQIFDLGAIRRDRVEVKDGLLDFGLPVASSKVKTSAGVLPVTDAAGREWGVVLCFHAGHPERVCRRAVGLSSATPCSAPHYADKCLARLRRKSRGMKCDVDAFACTLMFVAHKSGRYLAGHLGDGMIAMDDGVGEVITLSHPDNGEYANTTFVTEPDAVQRLRIYAGECAASAFAVMSDGTAESLYLRATGQPARLALSKRFHWTRTFPRSKTEGILAQNLEQAFAGKTTDDCSIGLMVIA